MKISRFFARVRRGALCWCYATFCAAFCVANDSDFEARIVADWKSQEARHDRDLASPEAFRDLSSRANALFSALDENDYFSSGGRAALMSAINEASTFDTDVASAADCEGAYCKLRWAMRQAEFENPLIRGIPVVFMKANRFGYQILQEYLSYYARYSNQHGGGFFVLKNPGFSFETTDLTTGRFPRGLFSTPSLSYDGKTLYFAFADFSKVQEENAPILTPSDLQNRGAATWIHDYLKESDGKYHLFKMDVATGEFEQLTEGPYDDFNPTLLPNGDLIFISTRRGGFARCNGPWEPISTATLHLRKPDGSIKTLSWHETNEWAPSVLSDGRVVYTRWDYVDRSASRYQGLWLTNPDGTGSVALFGNYTEDVCACIQAEEIPGSNKIMFVATAHHLAVGGPLVILDPSKTKYDPETGFDNLDSLERITPEICFPETPDGEPDGKPNSIPSQYYYSPRPLSEDFYLVSYSRDPLGGYLSEHGGRVGSPDKVGKLGLYYRDRFGNLELMFEDDEYSCRYPLPLVERETPDILPSRLPADSQVSDTGVFALSNVRESLIPFPENRKIKELRVFEILGKYPSPVGHNPAIGHDFAGNARRLLGSVPVEEDGSAYFRVPARKPLYFQVIDEEGKAVQTMLSEVYVQPGESRGCVGCHEQSNYAMKNLDARSIALARPASELQPGPDGTNPFNYTRLIQPVLDRSCVSCHSGKGDGVKPELTGEPQNEFTVSYNNFLPYLRWYEWFNNPIRRTVSFPGECGADMSPLTNVLSDDNHRDLKTSDKDKRLIYLWLDANIPFYGTYDTTLRQKQREGNVVEVPEVPRFE